MHRTMICVETGDIEGTEWELWYCNGCRKVKNDWSLESLLPVPSTAERLRELLKTRGYERCRALLSPDHLFTWIDEWIKVSYVVHPRIPRPVPQIVLGVTALEFYDETQAFKSPFDTKDRSSARDAGSAAVPQAPEPRESDEAGGPST